MVPPSLPPSFMEQSGSGGSNLSVDGVSSRSPVVAPSPSSLSQRVSAPSVSCPSLLVRRLGRGLGRPSLLSGRFGPVGHPSGSVVYQRQGPASCSAGAFPVPVSSLRSHSGCLLRQHHSGAFPSQGGGTWSPLLNTLAPAILRWMESISIRLPPQFLPGSDNVLTDSLSRPHQLPHPEWSIHMTVFLFLRRLWPVQIVSLQPRPLIVVRFTSPLSGIRGQQARTRFSSSGTAFRLTRSVRWLSSAYYREAPGLHGDGTHSCGSPLGSAPLVFGPGPALTGSSSDPTVPCRPPALDSVSSSLPGSPLAQASCLATLQRFPRAAGFSSAIAEQSSLARRPSSRAVSQVRWCIYHGWYHSNGHYISNPTFAMVADSCVTYGTPEALVCPPCVVTVQFYLRFSVFTFRPCLRIRCFGFCSAPSNSLQRSVCYVPILGTCLWCWLSSLTGL